MTEHLRKYKQDKRLPPSWKSLEVVSLGTLSKLYSNLKRSVAEKDVIATELGLPTQDVLENWLLSITSLRNVAAHHGRLFQRTLGTNFRTPFPTLPGRWIDLSTVRPKSVYANLSRMAYILQFVSPGNRFSLRLWELFQKYPSVRFKEVGFPANWRGQGLWRL